MAKAQRKTRRSQKEERLPFGKENFILIGIGLFVILLGYIALAIGPVEGFLPLVVAPVLLVLGYCVIIPVGILFKKSYIKTSELSQTSLHESKA